MYSGPFDVLLGMIANRRLELTEVSLSAITGEFISYVRGLDFGDAVRGGPSDSDGGSGGGSDGMDEASAFIDVASVLIEAKSVSLLPADVSGEHDESSMEALRERDLLFARLLQYRAYKEASHALRERMAHASGRYPHPGVVDDRIRGMLPELDWNIGPDELARIAARAIAAAPTDRVSVHQLHVPLVDLREQSRFVMTRLVALGEGGSSTFDELTADASDRIETVARFLALLAFFKQGAIQFRQDGPYSPLHVRWVWVDGTPVKAVLVTDGMIEEGEGA